MSKFSKMQTSTLQKMVNLSTTSEADKAAINDELAMRAAADDAKAETPKKQPKAAKPAKPAEVAEPAEDSEALAALKEARARNKAKMDAYKANVQLRKELRQKQREEVEAVRDEQSESALTGKTLSAKMRGETITGVCRGMVYDARGPIFLVRLEVEGPNDTKRYCHPSLSSVIATSETSELIGIYLAELENRRKLIALENIDAKIAELEKQREEYTAQTAEYAANSAEAFAGTGVNREAIKAKVKEIQDRYEAEMAKIDLTKPELENVRLENGAAMDLGGNGKAKAKREAKKAAAAAATEEATGEEEVVYTASEDEDDVLN